MTALEGLIGTLPMAGRPDPPDLSALRFIFITGKGGVGKTTVAGALGLSLAARGKRVLIAMCNSKERLSAILETPPIGHEIEAVGPNLWATNIDPEIAMHEYGQIVLRVRALTRAVFDNRYTKAFFKAVPGLTEWSILGKAWYLTTEEAGGRPRFDVVILDAPATGHGLDMLRVPKVILDVVPPGTLRRDAEAAWALFQDRRRAGVVVVTLPEEMPTTETLELSRSIRDELGLPIHQVVINAVLPPLFSEGERRALLTDRSLLDLRAPARYAGDGESAVVAGARRALRERVQEDSLRRLLSELDLPVVFLPHLFDEASTAGGTRRLAGLL